MNHKEVFQTIAESILQKKMSKAINGVTEGELWTKDGSGISLIFNIYFVYYGFRKIAIMWHTIPTSAISILKKKLGLRFYKLKTKNVSTYMIGGPKLSLRTFQHLGKMYQRVFGKMKPVKDTEKIHKKIGQALGYITPSGRKAGAGYQQKVLFFHLYTKKRILLRGQLYGPQSLIFRKVQKKILLKKIQKKVDKMNKLLAKLDKAWEVRYEIK